MRNSGRRDCVVPDVMVRRAVRGENTHGGRSDLDGLDPHQSIDVEFWLHHL
jgi:hypothetical protein